jgi:pheromone shutdown-related protein TraB
LVVLRKLGDRLTLVGVAHILPKSRDEVKAAIEGESPEVVAVELCPARYAELVGGVDRSGAREAMRPRELAPSVFNKFFYLLQTKFARRTGMPAGEEMLIAIERARKVGARVELIDRDINLTLQRLVERMGPREKLRLLLELLVGLLPFGGRVDLERLTEEEVVDRLLSSLKRALPGAYEVLIEERNSYMAAKIAMLLSSTKGKIVCVVGAGHISGICRRLESKWQAKLEYSLSTP